MLFVRTLTTWLIGLTLVALALGMAGPAGAAADPHDMAHIAAPVMAGDPHHHDASGAVVEVVHEPSESPDTQWPDDGGHEHLPSTSHAHLAVETPGPQLVVPHRAAIRLHIDATHRPPSLTSPPQNRPPRFA